MMKNYSFLVYLLLLSGTVFTQVNTWNGSSDNDWHKSCNWSLNTIPTTAHDVTIPTVGTYPTITGNAHCRTLNITSAAANAITVNSSGGANLCISSTNGGACTTPLTNNTGASANNTTSTAAICENQTKTLVGSPAGGTWTIVSGGGSISGNTYTPPNVASNTNVTVRYSLACPVSTSDRTFTVNVRNVANNTTSTASICENQTKALIGSPGGGSWSVVSGGGSISGTTYTPPNVASNTSVTVRYTIPANGGCPATTSDRTFTVNVRNVASNTTSTAAICENQTKALAGSPGGGSWSIVSGGGSISGTTYTPPNVASNTSVTVRYTIPANGACAATISNRTFTVNVRNVANNTTSTAAIDDDETKALTGSPGGGSWSIVSGGGSISGTTYTPPDVSSATSVTVRYTIPANGACPATTSDRTFTVNNASVPGSAFSPGGSTLYGPYFCTPFQNNHTRCRTFNNNTSFDITLTIATNIPCTNRNGGETFLIPAMGSGTMCITQVGCCAGPNNSPGELINWSSTDGASGSFYITLESTL